MLEHVIQNVCGFKRGTHLWRALSGTRNSKSIDDMITVVTMSHEEFTDLRYFGRGCNLYPLDKEAWNVFYCLQQYYLEKYDKVKPVYQSWMYTIESIKESEFNSFCDVHQFWMFTTASDFNSFCDKIGFHKVNDVLLKKDKVKKMIPKKEILNVTKSCISAHGAEFTFSEKVEALNFVVENILNISPSSPLYC